MKVELLVARAGLDFSQSAGDVVEVSDDEAKRMIEAGQAKPVRGVAPEKAVGKKKFERAVSG